MSKSTKVGFQRLTKAARAEVSRKGGLAAAKLRADARAAEAKAAKKAAKASAPKKR